MDDVKSEPELDEAYQNNFKNKYYQFDKYLMDNPTFMELLMLRNLQPKFFTAKESEILDKVEKESLIANAYVALDLYGMMYYDHDKELYQDVFASEPLIETGFENLSEEKNKKFVTGMLELDFDTPINEKYLNKLNEARRVLFKAVSDAQDFADVNYNDSEISEYVNHNDLFDKNISDVFHVANRIKDRYKYLIQNLDKKKLLKGPSSSNYYTRSNTSIVDDVQRILNERISKSEGGKKKDPHKTMKRKMKGKGKSKGRTKRKSMKNKKLPTKKRKRV